MVSGECFGVSEGFYEGPKQVSSILTILTVRTLTKRSLGVCNVSGGSLGGV